MPDSSSLSEADIDTLQSAPDRLLAGAIDCHVHIGPEPFQERRLDTVSLALEAREAGMRAMVIKSHYYCTAPVAHLVNQIVPDFSLLGSLTLNGGAGGLNPEVVDVAVEVGTRVIWMPTYSSMPDIGRRAEGKRYPVGTTTNVPISGISLLASDGKLVPQMMTILEIMKGNNVALATGHVSVPETYAVTAEARRMGIEVIITHPLSESTGSRLSREQQQELAALGAYIEYTFVPCMPSSQQMNPAVMVEHVKAIGVEHCILTTDFGQNTNPPPPEGFRMMLATMLRLGLSEKELDTLVRTNPARLLGLD